MMACSPRGLSPRVRGNPDNRTDRGPGRGSIPACAGEPSGRQRCRGGSWVYPRVCGGTKPNLSQQFLFQGLSPRVRGNLQLRWGAEPKLGSIPACAGEPLRCRPQPPPVGVYPRVCGGTGRHQPERAGRQGLSPRVRGNLIGTTWRAARSGSIPACAGEPSAWRGRGHAAGVYPRVCGGTVSAARLDAGQDGLSPRVRGNPKALLGFRPSDGSIPACAGEPAVENPRINIKRVYPRVCGGTSSH